jgi:hypothetical protein
MKLMWLMQILQ